MNFFNKLKAGQIFGNSETNNYLVILCVYKDKIAFIQNDEIVLMPAHSWDKSYRADDDFIEYKNIESELERRFIKAFFSEIEDGYTF